jgi:WD40 repeat protein
MRPLVLLALVCCVPSFISAQEKGGKEAQPIKVVEIKRTDPVRYEQDIEPILRKSCMACHGGSIKESRLDMGSYDSLIKGGKRGAALVPGKAESSNLYKMSAHTQKPFMPPKDETPLTPEELALIKLWIDQGARAPSGERVRPVIVVGTPPATVHPVRALAVSFDKSALAVGRGNQIHIYDAGSGTFIRTHAQPELRSRANKDISAAHLSVVESLGFSPDGKFLASGSFQEVCIWDVQSGQLLHKLTGFAHSVVALAFSANSKLLATGGGVPSEDGEIKIFETASWNLRTQIKKGHSDTVYGVSFNPDGSMLATCSADKFIKVFELPSGKFVKSFEGHTHHVLDVGWRSDGKLLASAGADNVVKIWDYEKGEQIRTIPAHGKQVTRLLFIGKTPQFVTCSGDAQVRFWNADNGGNVRNFGGNNDFVYAVGVSPDGSVVVAGGEEGVVRVYNGNTSQLVRTLTPPK